jgi:hypothetical protein
VIAITWLIADEKSRESAAVGSPAPVNKVVGAPAKQ